MTGTAEDGDRSIDPQIIVVMGVAGCGKSTVGRLLADRLGWEYIDADTFHSRENIAKMHAGTALTAADRRPWMDSIADWIDDRLEAGRPAVIACSALKRADREHLADGRPGVRIVHLHGDRDLIARRVHARIGHFFDPRLLDSQFRELEPPATDEDVLNFSILDPPDEIADSILTALKRHDRPHPES